MKILSARQTQQADAYTIKHEPIASIDLMERASTRFTNAFCDLVDSGKSVLVVCGTGNNGGDGLAVARMLLEKGYNIHVIVIQPREGGSKDFLINLGRLDESVLSYLRSEEEKIELGNPDVIIDAIFGSGLTRPVKGVFGKVIAMINKLESTVIAIDVPSGLFLDKPASAEGAIIEANHTISFQVPKLAFFFPENYPFVGEWQVVDIGLNREFIDQQESKFSTIEYEEVVRLLKPRKKFDHKGRYGHAQLIGGSYGKMGAITLASRACLRSGVGLLTLTIPSSGVEVMQTSVPEAMVLEQPGEKQVTEFTVFDKATAIGVGPGLGTANETKVAFENFLQSNSKPLVIDADAINLLAANRALLEILPEGTILTPHLKEFDRLAGESANNWQRLEKAEDLCNRYQLSIVLKGAHTAIVDPDNGIAFNTTGNPGMATAGSGDVLLGIITSFRAQGMSPNSASKAGVYVHATAGDRMASKKSMESLIAGDLIEGISDFFLNGER